jgi:sialic acid synthase SpsE/mannose-6-phosphate isomerase-like protein (cupin superfamily)
MKSIDLNDLFILDLANNHQGDLEHGINIIRSLGEVSKRLGVRAALKFQFRQLDTFIHPDFKEDKDVKHIPRFLSTALPHDDYRTLTNAVREHGMLTICTPFDEESVDVILDMGIEIIKVASCSASDWPLLKKIASTNRPVVISTAGLSLNKIDRIVSFMEYNNVNFALMHCVAIYPTPDEKLNLNQIELLKKRFPDVPVGFSTHEAPSNFDIIRVACAKGARLFERHVGMQTDKYKLNAYSSSPQEVERWMQAYLETIAMCGGSERGPASPLESESLQSLMRGVYARNKIKKGQELSIDDVFFAMPLQDGQMTSGEWSDGISSEANYKPNQAISNNLASVEVTEQERVFRIMLQVKGILNNARVFIGKNSSIEISHHYGLERFREFGAVIIDCINREYCKKLLVMLPRQKHPYHFHKRKEETFQLLWGDLEVELNGRQSKMKVGDLFLVKPDEWHKFHTLDGVIFEEVSTTHYNDDSFYEDDRVAKLPRDFRKTKIPNWEDVQNLQP